MFQCRECGSLEFELMMQPHIQGKLSIELTEDEDVMIHVEGHRSFMADLYFMNQFGVCKHCQEINCWAYHYPNRKESSEA